MPARSRCRACVTRSLSSLVSSTDSAFTTLRAIVSCSAEDVLELAVVAVGPHVRAGRGVDQLRVDAHAVAAPAHAAFEHVARVQRLADLAHVARLALVLERRVARDDDKARHLREVGDEVLGHAVGEVRLVGVAAHVVERQHGDRRLARRRGRGGRRRLAWRAGAFAAAGVAGASRCSAPRVARAPRRRRSAAPPPRRPSTPCATADLRGAGIAADRRRLRHPVAANRECAHRLGDVLHRLRAEIVERRPRRGSSPRRAPLRRRRCRPAARAPAAARRC